MLLSSLQTSPSAPPPLALSAAISLTYSGGRPPREDRRDDRGSDRRDDRGSDRRDDRSDRGGGGDRRRSPSPPRGDRGRGGDYDDRRRSASPTRAADRDGDVQMRGSRSRSPSRAGSPVARVAEENGAAEGEGDERERRD